MKKAIVFLIAVVLLLFCTQAYARDFGVWLWGGEGTNVRLGYFVDPNTEVGASVAMWDSDDEPQKIGMYLFRHLPNLIEVPNPIPMPWLPETLVGSPYFGAKLERDVLVNMTIFSPVAGIAIDPFFIEYRFRSFDGEGQRESTTVIGIRFDF